MSKFHINKHGVPAPCRAQKGNCPLGGDSGDENHFNTQEEAQEHADKKNSEQHGILPGVGNEQRSEASIDLENRLKDGDVKRVEREMVYHKAEDVEGAYNTIQEMRDSNGSINKSYNSLMKEKIDLSNQLSQAREAIEEDIYRNGEIGQEIKEQERKDIDLVSLMDEGKSIVEENNSGDCPKCGKGKMVERKGKHGTFIGCNNFPECKHTQKKLKENPRIQVELDKAKTNRQLAIQRMQAEAKEIQSKDPKSIELNEKLKEVDSKHKIAEYASNYQNPKKDPMYPNRAKSQKTPVEQYYEERKTADESLEKQIGKNKIAMNSGQMRYGSSNKLEADLRVDKDGKVDNLYLETENSKGKAEKVVKIHENGGLQLENGENVTMSHTTNWNMGRGRQHTPPQTYKLYTTDSKGEKYEGNTNVAFSNRDSSD